MTGAPTVFVFNKYHRDAPTGAVYIGRGSPWGNPFAIGPLAEGKHGDREQVIAAHRDWLLAQPELMQAVRGQLVGKALVCFCAPKACHGDTLAHLANMAQDQFESLLRAAS